MAAKYSERYSILDSWPDRKKIVDKRGYIRIFVPEHPKSFSGGWVYEHRLVMETASGRILKRGEQVHHISENKKDNSENNLFVCYQSEHLKAHDNAHLA